MRVGPVEAVLARKRRTMTAAPRKSVGKGVVRSYFSAGETGSGSRVERDARAILQQQFHGTVID